MRMPEQRTINKRVTIASKAVVGNAQPTSSKTRRLLLLGLALLVLVGAGAGFLWVRHSHAPASAEPTQQQQDALASEQRVLVEDPATSGRDDTRALTYLNLADTYVDSHECAQAAAALGSAKGAATSRLQSAVSATATYIRQHCG